MGHQVRQLRLIAGAADYLRRADAAQLDERCRLAANCHASRLDGRTWDEMPQLASA
jgi:hypothetical protein